MSSDVKQPTVQWAQRLEWVLVTVPVQDVSSLTVRIFGGTSPNLTISFVTTDGLKQPYLTTLPLFDDVLPEESSYSQAPRQIEIKMRKKKSGAWWPRLTKDKRPTQVQIDWSRWKDEDDEGSADSGDFGSANVFQSLGIELSAERHNEMMNLMKLLEDSRALKTLDGSTIPETGRGNDAGSLGIPAFGSAASTDLSTATIANGQSTPGLLAAKAADDEEDYSDMPPLEPNV